MNRYVLRDGRQLVLGGKLGEGGEGAVHEIRGQPDLVAKVYTKPISKLHADKLDALCSSRTDSLSSVCAWPTQIVYYGHRPCGFTMPRLDDAIQIHELFGSASRRKLFPAADWTFLIHVAKNLAAALHKLHNSNVVVGDFNQRNIVVFKNGIVKFLDCDSFQIENSGKTYYCTVGVPEFTPPELQACTTFDGVKRTSQHDLFALAVMVFHLLFLGRHPFSGDPIDSKVLSFELQDAIASQKFAYSPNARRFGVRPPRLSPPVDRLGEGLIGLFVRAFETKSRPSANEWFVALNGLESQLARCSQNTGHVFPARLKACPWCEYDIQWSVMTFLPSACPPRTFKALDVNKLLASVEYCLKDIPIVFPQTPIGFKPRPLPELLVISKETSDSRNAARIRLWNATMKVENLRLSLAPSCIGSTELVI